MSRLVVVWSALLLVASPALAQEPAGESPVDALFKLLQGTQGKMEIVGDGTRYRLFERVEFDMPGQPGSRLFADFVDVDRETNRLIAEGNVTFATPEGRVNAQRVDFNLSDRTAVFYDATGVLRLPDANPAQFANQDPDVIFEAERVERLSPRRYVIHKGWFTTCLQPTARWEVGTSSVRINLDDYAFARNVVLRVKGVPLLYLPAIYYPLEEEGRSTGFLMPTYGTFGNLGFRLSNAFFWAIGRSHDATFFHDWYTRAGTGQGAEYRYVSGPGSSGQIRVHGLNERERLLNDQLRPARTSYQVNAAATHTLPAGLRAQGNVEYFTDVTTQQLYQQNVYQRSSSQRRVSGGLTGVFGPATLGGYFSRTEQFSDDTRSFVYGSTPRATANIAPLRLFGSPVYASLNSEFVFQPNRQLEDGVVTSDQSLARLDIMPTVRVPLSRLTYLSVNTNATYRQTYFSRSLDAAGVLIREPVGRRYMSLETDVIGPVLSKIWDTPGSRFSDRMKHVIEPTFNLEYITEIANQARVPVTDSGAIAVGGAARLTYGVTNRWMARTPASGDARGSTREFLTVGVQQTYYTDPETSRYDTTYASTTGRPRPVDLSPVAVTARLSPVPSIDANGRLEYDVTGNGLQVLTAGSTINSASASASLNFSRQRFTPESEASSYLSASTSWRMSQGRLSGFYGLHWDIGGGYIFSQNLGGAYLAQCCGVQADFSVYTFPAGSPFPADRRLNFAFVLAGLGTFSNFFGLVGQP